MKSVRPSLQFIILAPVVGLMLIAGFVLYFLVLRTIGAYAEDNIRTTLDSLLQSAVAIADSEVDRQNRESSAADPDGALAYQLNARMRFEDFARGRGVGLIVVADGAVDFATGVASDSVAAVLQAASGTRQLSSLLGNHYLASANFTPWNWRILLIKDAHDFDALIRQVQLIYGGSAIALLVLTGLLVWGLRQILVRPIYQIADEFSSGRAPTYRGVKELEHLSDSIGTMLESLRAKTLHLETTLESMSDAIAVYDAEMRLVAWNRRYLSLYRYPEALVARRNPFCRHHALQRRPWRLWTR